VSAPEDEERWTARLRMLAQLIDADALAVLLPLGKDRLVSFAGANQPAGAWWEGTVAEMVAASAQHRIPQRRAGLRLALADGREAQAALAAPVTWQGRTLGHVVALRSREPFAASESTVGARVGALVGIELAVANERLAEHHWRQAADGRLAEVEETRRHAILLYEVARANGAADRAGALFRTVDIVADSLGCQLVALFEQRVAGTLTLAAAHGHPPGAPREQALGADALLGRAVTAAAPFSATLEDPRPAWAGAVSRAVLAPVPAGATPGVLVLGRADGPFDDHELDLAAAIAELIAPSRGAAAGVRHHDRTAVERRPGPQPTQTISAPVTQPPLPEPRTRRWIAPLAVALLLAAAAAAAVAGGALPLPR